MATGSMEPILLNILFRELGDGDLLREDDLS